MPTMAQEHIDGTRSSGNRDVKHRSSEWKQRKLDRQCKLCINKFDCPLRNRITYAKFEEYMVSKMKRTEEKLETYCHNFERTVSHSQHVEMFHLARQLVHDDKVIRQVARREGVLQAIPSIEENREFISGTMRHFERLEEMVEIAEQMRTKETVGRILAEDAKRAFGSMQATSGLVRCSLKDLMHALEAKYIQ